MAGKGSDIRPLRQEDYQAMAERARVAEAALAKLTVKKQRNYKKILGRIGLLLIVVGAVVLAAKLIGIDPADHRLPKAHVAASERQTACYFVRRVDGQVEPWKQDWRVFRSDHEGGWNHEVEDRQGFKTTYSSQWAAWDFLASWYLEPCR